MAISGYVRSEADVITEVLANLGAIAVGQPQDPEDTAFVQAKYDSVLRMISALELGDVADPNNVPGVWFEPIVNILAQECALKFGVAPDDYQRLVQKGLGSPPGTGDAARALKIINRGRPTYAPLQIEYF
jgi:hypothetical protein